MPVSLSTARDPFRGCRNARAQARPSGPAALRVPQARILRALFPMYPEDPPLEWPLFTRAALAERAGYTALSGTATRALNGIRPGNRTSGTPHPGLIDLGLIEAVEVDVVGVVEVNYRITAAGIAAYRAFTDGGGTLPPVRDPEASTNDRYRTAETTGG